jgi:hypothetical protein
MYSLFIVLDKYIKHLEIIMQILKSLGFGNQSVYVYYFPNDKLLADKTGVNSWECKIGMTTNGDTIGRIDSQCKTSRHQSPIIALEIRTDNATALESELHRVFYLERINTGKFTGDEWFIINPKHIENYYNLHIHQSEVWLTPSNSFVIDDENCLGRAVHQIRKQLKLRQTDLGIPRLTVMRLETGKHPTKTDTLFKVIDALNCKLMLIPK